MPASVLLALVVLPLPFLRSMGYGGMLIPLVSVAVALTLLGYPEGSIGRLMTPHYVAVREQWTLRDVVPMVLDHFGVG